MRIYDENDNKADIVKLAIRRSLESDGNKIDSVKDAVRIIKAKGIRTFVGGYMNWASTPEGSDFWSIVYSSFEQTKDIS